jgi:hypothetical protein
MFSVSVAASIASMEECTIPTFTIAGIRTTIDLLASFILCVVVTCLVIRLAMPAFPPVLADLPESSQDDAL